MTTTTKRRHPACVLLTLLLLLWILFPARWSAVRLFDSFADLLISVAFYLTSIIGFDDLITPTVNRIPDVPFAPLLPVEPARLQEIVSLSWRRLFVGDHFLDYLAHVGDVLRIISRYLLPVVLIVVLLVMQLQEVADEETDLPGDSRRLQRLKRFIKKMKKPVAAVRGFISYVRRSLWLPIWIVMLICGSNLASQALGILSYYFYFAVEIDLKSLYLQLYKLSLDISVALAAVPLPIWGVPAWILFDRIRRHFGVERLRKFECRNAAFLDELPLVALITGTMGSNKTKMLTDFTLTIQDNFRRRQLDTIMKIEGEFPWFDWNAYGADIRKSFRSREIRSLASARDFALARIRKFLQTFRPEDLYGYNTAARGVEFDNGIVTVSLFDRIIDYARLFYMYNVGCTISSNYSIRVGDKMDDRGNLPLWQNDYFDCPSVPYNAPTRHSHIVDFDTLRLGKTVDKASEVAGAFEFGVVAHTEMGKDYGNSLTNADYKRSDPNANPKNDMMIARQKLSRHPATVCYYPYYRYIGDDQRPESVGADARDVMYVIRAKGAGENKSTVHVLLLESFLPDLLRSIWNGWYVRYRHNRRDETVPSYLLKTGMKYIAGRHERKFDRFIYNVVDLSVEQGTLEGEATAAQYFLSHKKIHARRYATDCFVDVFADKAERSKWSLEDSPTFRDDVASLDEVVRTNSYFGAELLKISREQREPPDAENDDPAGAGSAPERRRRRP